MSNWQKRLSKKEFLALPKQQQKRYIKNFPHSSHRFLLSEKDRKKEDDMVSGGMNKILLQGNQDIVIHPGGERQVSDIHKKRKELADVRKDITDINKTNAGVINPASVRALATVTDGHLRLASENIKKNKQDIVSAVQEQTKKQPAMYRRGLRAVEEIVSGEAEDNDLKIVERHAMHRAITGIATMAVLGAGVLAMSVAAAPLGVLAGSLLFKMWSHGSGGKNLRDDINTLRQARERKRRDKTQQELEEMGHSKRNARKLAHRKHKGQPLRRTDFEDDDYMAAASTASEYDSTINLIVDQVADILQYHTARDFQTDGSAMFEGIASAHGLDHTQIAQFLAFAGAQNVTENRQGVEFEYGGSFASLSRFMKGMEFEATASEIDGNKLYQYRKPEAYMTLAPVTQHRYYLMYDGEIFPS